MSLLRTGRSSNRLDRFAQCGSACFIHVHDADRALKLTANHCHDKFCRPCGLAQARFVAASLESATRQFEVRFITLTLKHNATPLDEQIDRLYRSFAELRRRKWWKEHVKGGAAFLEIKLSDVSGLWHPHFHILAQGVWMDARELSKLWHGITGDSFKVDIQAIRNPEEQFSYVTKYAGKPVDASVTHKPDKLDEAVLALHRRRCCFTFGTWRGIELKPHAKPTEGWVCIGRLDQCIADALSGDEHAQRLLEALKRHNSPPFASSIPSAP
jgi:hypothetical protein